MLLAWWLSNRCVSRQSKQGAGWYKAMARAGCWLIRIIIQRTQDKSAPAEGLRAGMGETAPPEIKDGKRR
eukprot:15127-Chlamydomonas_euryale.AAC.10